jgi:phosphoglycolate phosphatase
LNRLVLFDIDGTLLSAGAISRIALVKALEASFGTRGDLASYDFSGKTDPQIVLELMGAAGVPEPTIRARLPQCLALYEKTLVEELRPEHVEEKPGVSELLMHLSQEKSVTLGLLTGNLERCARLKLDPLSLNRYFPFGAFGSDHEDRYKLPRVAVARARDATGLTFEGKSIVIVGDSIHDVRCGKDLSVRAVAVASGRTSAAALALETPDCLLGDLKGALDSILA